MNSQIGKYIMLAGLAIAAIGLIIYLLGNKLSWFGHLPGDVRIDRDNFKLFFPVTSMILVSIVLNVLIYLVKKIL